MKCYIYIYIYIYNLARTWYCPDIGTLWVRSEGIWGPRFMIMNITIFLLLMSLQLCSFWMKLLKFIWRYRSVFPRLLFHFGSRLNKLCSNSNLPQAVQGATTFWSSAKSSTFCVSIQEWQLWLPNLALFCVKAFASYRAYIYDFEWETLPWEEQSGGDAIWEPSESFFFQLQDMHLQRFWKELFNSWP